MKVFVYGTLRKGGHNHGVLNGAKYVGVDYIEGFTLYDLPYGFPCIVKGEGRVMGEVYEVDDDRILERLDILEGYKVQYEEDSMYLRRNIMAESGEMVAYYLWNRPIPPMSKDLSKCGLEDWLGFKMEVRKKANSM